MKSFITSGPGQTHSVSIHPALDSVSFNICISISLYVFFENKVVLS